MGELPDADIWVYCGTGGRTAVACSLLERAGRSPVMIDDFALPGDTPWDDAAEALAG
jgi:rhodanese-related sulfurtransferase